MKQPNYSEQNECNATINYGGTRRSINVTCNAAELQVGIRKQKDDFEKVISSHQEYQRVKKGKRTHTVKDTPKQEKLKSGSFRYVPQISVTTRSEH